MPDMLNATDLSFYSDGDIPTEWVKLIDTHGLDLLEGTWEIILERSDACDEIMAALGIGIIKRAALRSYHTRVEVRIVPRADAQSPKVYIVTHLPMGFKKEGTVPTDGGSFDQADSDTGVIWKTESTFLNGRLCQRRTSNLGVMYDIRCVFKHDPEGKCETTPLQLFKWTFVDRKGKKITANRWMKKVV